MNFYCIYFNLLIGSFLTSFGQCDVIFKDMQAVKHGLAYPYEIRTHPEHDVMSRLLSSVVNQERCILRTPDFIDIDMVENTNPKYERWGTGCGARIKNVQKEDHGRWQLVSIRGDRLLQGVFSVIVDDPSSIHIGGEFDYVEGNQLDHISFLESQSQYCMIGHDRDPENMVVHGDCVYPVGIVQRRLQGKWNLGVGMPGSINEIHVEKEVIVRLEDLDIGFTEDRTNNVVHVYCNLKNSLKQIEFCRFERIADKQAFNLNDGLGRGRYSYYGRGLYMKDCGLSILNPTTEDYGSWRCTVGVTTISDNIKSVMRGAMLVTSSASRFVDLYKDTPRVILSVAHRPLRVVCSANVSIIYCSVVHPNGTIISPNVTNEAYTFSSENLNIGQCELTIKEGEISDSGEWACYMGGKQAGLELIDVVTVRVGGALAAVEPAVHGRLGESVTLHCLTAGGYQELRYCRFITPYNVPFHIDETVTEENAIQGEFFYPKSSHIYTGDCAVTIKLLRIQHFGEWKCLAMIKNEDTEYTDTIRLVAISDGNALSTASVTGISVGVVLLIIMVLVGIVMWRRKAIPNLLRRNNQQRETEAAIHYPGRPSGESSDSGDVNVTIPTGRTTTYGGATSSNM